MSIREVRPADVPAVVELVHELAAYEREPDSCLLTAAQLHTALFGARPALFGHVAEVDGAGVDGAEVDGTVVGCALWFLNFSTWRGVHGIYLEDLYVRPAHRGLGLGRALLATLAGVCAERGYGRLEWSVLDWNEPSIRFYRSLGVVPMAEWTTYRLDGPALHLLAGAADPGTAHDGRPSQGRPDQGRPDHGRAAGGE
jgi:GNAT superfamily N-acetyltransferase